MNGIEKITQRIAGDAQSEADELLSQARAEARAIAVQWEEKASRETAELLAQGEKAADERAQRLDSAAQMEGKKLLLATRQEMISLAFDRALEKLRSLPQEEYIDLLASLCVKAAVTGREEVIFSPEDRAKVGAKVCAKANELLARQVAPQLPRELSGSVAGAILDKVVTAGSALMAGTAMLTVSQETRDIRGGCVLTGDGVEVNCAFDTLVRLSRPTLERQVAQVLFGE